ncbi:MAG: metallophosphoesterase [Victivallales bacterium]|nr:metallophosphoesterase [Victivallales bacterium]
MKIAVITDLHYSLSMNVLCPDRAGEKACELLEAALTRLGKIGADILLVGGDLVNDPKDTELLDRLAVILAKAPCPFIAIPGNHDPVPEEFYQHIPMSHNYLDINGIRIIPFPEDVQTEGYNARRSPESLERQRRLSSCDLPCVSFQHVPLFPTGTVNSPYHYDNADEIYTNCGPKMVLAISGHDHCGRRPSFHPPFPSIIVPALCQKNYPFAIIELDAKGNLLSYSLLYVSI